MEKIQVGSRTVKTRQVFLLGAQIRKMVFKSDREGMIA